MNNDKYDIRKLGDQLSWEVHYGPFVFRVEVVDFGTIKWTLAHNRRLDSLQSRYEPVMSGKESIARLIEVAVMPVFDDVRKAYMKHNKCPACGFVEGGILTCETCGGRGYVNPWKSSPLVSDGGADGYDDYPLTPRPDGQ